MNANNYADPVADAVEVLSRLSGAVISDLDVEVGGVGWWDGQIDLRRRAVLSDYLIDSVNGAAEALKDAALAAREHRETLHADDHWLLTVWRAVAADPLATNDDFLLASQRGEREERRERKVSVWASASFNEALHALDCIAAAVLIVAAIPENVRRADWGTVEALATKATNGSTSQKLDPVGSPGRLVQEELLRACTRWQEHGPDDWLPWLRAVRNSQIHRGARVHWLMLYGERRAPEGLLRTFPPQPDLTDVEAIARSDTKDPEGVAAIRLLRRSSDIVDGLVGSMASFVLALARALERCWQARRTDPQLLFQRGAQWQDLERASDLNFPGYGPNVRVLGDVIHWHPQLATRLLAAHVVGDRRSTWTD